VPQIELKKVYGLELQSNSFEVREGSLEVAENIVLSQDNIYKKRRGDKTFYDPTTVTIRNLGEYNGKVLGFASDRVQVYTQVSGDYSSVSTLSGATVSISSGSKARYVAANNNLYFTTSTGVLKLESLTGNVLQAGIDSATDLQIFRQDFSASESFFRPDSQVAYRILFGRRDANNNLVLGSPSQIAVATNTVAASSSVSISSPDVTVTTSSNHGLSVTDVVYITGANGSGLADGVYSVTATPSATQFTVVGSSPSGITSLSWGTYKTTRLDYAIPSGVNTTEFICQIYRSSVSATSSVVPDESTLQLVDEFNLTSAQVTAGFGIYVDTTPDILRGAYLYTNPNTGEAGGIAAANEKPPVAQDIAVFKNFTFYANVQTPYQLLLSLISSTSTNMPNGAEFTTTSGATTRTYIGSTGAGNRTLRATSVGFVTTTVTITYNGHAFSNGDTVAVAEALDASGVQLATLPQGNYTVANVTANTFDITAPQQPTGLTALTFQGVSTAAGKRLFYIDNTSSTSVSLDATARAIVRALNRDSSGAFNAFYVSSVNEVPGKMALRTRSLTVAAYINAVTAAIVDSFTPQIPTSGQTAIATRDSGAGVVYISKSQRPEAVPIANALTIGSRSSAILRVRPLRDSLIIVKEDGVYRINGSDLSSFSATILDNTVICKAADSVATLNNEVYLLASQGVVAVSETSARIVSRAIEPLFSAIVGDSDLAAETHGVGYESERLYLLNTLGPSPTDEEGVVYCYNAVTDAWTTWDKTFLDALVFSTDDKLYSVDGDNVIVRERKSQNRLDYCDEDYAVTVLTTPSTTTATLNIVGATAEVGDIVVIDDIINRITAITSVNGVLTYTFARAFSFEATDTGRLYKGITSTIRLSPLTGGDSSRFKQFSEFTINYRNATALSRVTVSFLTDSLSGSTATEWVSTVLEDGWGNAPWGNFGWGQEEGINSVYETSNAQPLRIYVPLEASRATYIQANIEHSAAAESLMIQSIAYTSRVYGQRISR
jgi:hypothetical protein